MILVAKIQKKERTAVFVVKFCAAKMCGGRMRVVVNLDLSMFVVCSEGGLSWYFVSVFVLFMMELFRLKLFVLKIN